MDPPARAAAEVFLDLLGYVDPERKAAPTEADILATLERLMDDESLTFRLDSAGELLVRCDQLAIGVTSLLTWLVSRVVERGEGSRAAVVADLRRHIALQ